MIQILIEINYNAHNKHIFIKILVHNVIKNVIHVINKMVVHNV